MRKTLALLSLLVVMALAGCGTAANTPTAAPLATRTTTASPTVGSSATPMPYVPPTVTTAPATVAATSSATRTATPDARPTATQTALSATAQIDVFVRGLDTPWAIAIAPDGRIFLSERKGTIRVVKDGVLQPEPWMTVPGVAEVGEAGLLGLAIDPQFAQNKFVYVAYTYRGSDGRLLNQLVRLREDADGKGALDKVLLSDVPGNSTHDGGRVKIGPDGKLYWTMGDAQNRPAAQDPQALNGKILRLNTDGSIPAENPFPGSPVYSYGHRNPQGLAWQPGSGRLYATEHGPSGGLECCRDELNLIEPGMNYGWPTITGDQTQQGLVSPVLNSGASVTWAPGGATFVTRGPWTGALLFSGLRGQALYRVVLDANNPRKAVSLTPLYSQQFGRLRDVVEAPDGTIYVLSSNLDGRGSTGPDGDVVLKLVFR